MSYTIDDLLVLGKRLNNTKRSYLLIDPLQAKHIPVSPAKALEMMDTLGKKIAAIVPETRLVIGFAETATAIGAAAAHAISSECVYINTTREKIASVKNWVEFREEHSHAAEQKLATDCLEKYISSTDTVVFVDDELSTGKTLINIVKQLSDHFPIIAEKRIIIATVINRLTDENRERLRENGIECVSLIDINNDDYVNEVQSIDIKSAGRVTDFNGEICGVEGFCFADTRTGVNIGEYRKQLEMFAKGYIHSMTKETGNRVAVIGTEESMYPALILGAELEKQFPSKEVKSHSTTRSPIGISQQAGYPIFNGLLFSSFYEKERQTYLYNISEYDTVIIVTDSAEPEDDAVKSLCTAFSSYGCNDIRLVKGE